MYQLCHIGKNVSNSLMELGSIINYLNTSIVYNRNNNIPFYFREEEVIELTLELDLNSVEQLTLNVITESDKIKCFNIYNSSSISFENSLDFEGDKIINNIKIKDESLITFKYTEGKFEATKNKKEEIVFNSIMIDKEDLYNTYYYKSVNDRIGKESTNKCRICSSNENLKAYIRDPKDIKNECISKNKDFNNFNFICSECAEKLKNVKIK